jgi:alpha-L-fucosidase
LTDGTFAEGEAKVARAMGEWLKKYGEAVYGTRGGPYRNGTWGGSCHRGDKLYLHVSEWPVEGLGFDPLSNKVIAARTLTGAPVAFKQSADEFAVEVAQKDREKPVTVIELTLEKPVESGRILGGAHAPKSYISEHGAVLSENAKLEISSASSQWDKAENHARLFSGDKIDYAFHTNNEKNPWAKVDLGAVKRVNAVVIENKPDEKRTDGLILSISEDGQKWEEIWRAKTWESSWFVPVARFDAGINAPGRQARFIKVETKGHSPRTLLLRRICSSPKRDAT